MKMNTIRFFSRILRCVFGVASTTKKSHLKAPPTMKKEKLQIVALEKMWFCPLPPWTLGK